MIIKQSVVEDDLNVSWQQNLEKSFGRFNRMGLYAIDLHHLVKTLVLQKVLIGNVIAGAAG